MLNFAVATTAHAKRFTVSNMQDFYFHPLGFTDWNLLYITAFSK